MNDAIWWMMEVRLSMGLEIERRHSKDCMYHRHYSYVLAQITECQMSVDLPTSDSIRWTASKNNKLQDFVIFAWQERDRAISYAEYNVSQCEFHIWKENGWKTHSAPHDLHWTQMVLINGWNLPKEGKKMHVNYHLRHDYIAQEGHGGKMVSMATHK